MSLVSQIASLADRVADEFNALRAEIAGDRWTYEKLASDWTNSTTTGTPIFTGFTPDPSADYEIEVLLKAITAATTTGFQFAIWGASTSIADSATSLIAPSAAGATSFVNPATWGAYAAAVAGMTTANLQVGRSLVRTNTTTPVDNIRAYGRSEIAASLVTVKAGSFMRWRRIA